MAVAGIDTHAVVKELKSVGFTEDQAEPVTRVVRQTQGIDLSDLATKADIAGLKADLANCATKAELAGLATRAELAEVRSELLRAMAETKSEILKWTVSTIGVQTIAMIGAGITLARMLH